MCDIIFVIVASCMCVVYCRENSNLQNE